MAEVPDVLVIGAIKMLAQIGDTEKIVEVCNEWLDRFTSRPTQDAADVGDAPVSEPDTSETCPHCNGNKKVYAWFTWIGCPFCKATGRVSPAKLDEYLRAAPRG